MGWGSRGYGILSLASGASPGLISFSWKSTSHGRDLGCHAVPLCECGRPREESVSFAAKSRGLLWRGAACQGLWWR
jgi:hypothetical protein